MYREGVGVSRISCGGRTIGVGGESLHESSCSLKIGPNPCGPFTFDASALHHREGELPVADGMSHEWPYAIA